MSLDPGRAAGRPERHHNRAMSRPRALVLLSLLLAPGSLEAAEPIRLGGLRLVLGGEMSGSAAETDRGFFNDSGYERNPLRLFRLSLTAEVRAGDHVAALTEVRSENLNTPRAYALYLRVRPWADEELDIQAGLIPPVFGSYGRRRYGADNPLIGEPLAYQYLTTLRADAFPASEDELLYWRGRGWLVDYPIGATAPAPGLPLVSSVEWDAGVQVRWAGERFEAAAALTQGTLSRPRVEDDNEGKQFSTRVAVRPLVGLVVGASAATGDYVADQAVDALAPPVEGRQRALGLDVEYSAGYALVRAEAVWSRWDAPTLRDDLEADGYMVEARYKLLPGFYVAARFDHVGFGDIAGSQGRAAWDAPTTRFEGGIGFSLRRNLLLKASWQRNERADGFRRQDFVAGQVLWWY